ncbi:titin isoform X2 [Drosophila guanche]|uniref:titin isoform X2 n=1 Tax=Drosophila guanche TaxID=7266 RepID=UPI00147203DF|nr:titin isoform X2 [Drosophila guanche]
MTRGKKKKKKKALAKVMLVGTFLKAKIELLLKILGAHLQVKFFAIALIGLLINIARFWIDVKRGSPPSKKRKNTATIMAREDKPEPPTAEVQEVQEMESEPEAAPAAAPAAPLGTLTLPSNATSIRADITDNFSCANKTYGYYADVENECQIFHVCLPVTYADGRENTFRWSFICPEDTIFSQESFTCMRREDMTIECEDSARYYELNGNFGGAAVQEEEKQPEQQQQQQAATIAEPEEEEEQQQEEKDKPVQAAPEPEPVPVAQPAKPVKVQSKPKPKPNRRKPQPHRKAPVTEAAPVAVETDAVDEPAAESKPIIKPQRFTMRPHKHQPAVAAPAPAPASAPAPSRNELFAGIRKRPAIFNKPTTTPKPFVEEVQAAVTEAVVELSEPQPTVQLQTMFEDAAPINVVEEVKEPEKQASEPEVQASEPAVATAQPEDATTEAEAPTRIEIDTRLEEMKPIEAIEEIPAVIVESLEAAKPQEAEEEKTQAAEEDKPQAAEEEKPQTAEEEIKEEPHVEAEKEVPAVEAEKEMPTAEEEKEVPAKVEEIVEGNRNEPAIIESDEEILGSIEALEAAKPSDAPESIAATPEMQEHSPLVEEILQENKDTQESLGGFKPVDPAMAAEAEQLITDFLNTLKKNEEKPETELATAAMDMAETLNEKLEPSPDVSVEEAKLPEPEIVDKNASIEEQMLEESELQKSPEKLMTDSPIINIMQFNHLPMDYQIPVQVIPLEQQMQPQMEINAKPEAPEEVKEEVAPEEVKEVAPAVEETSAIQQETEPEVQPEASPIQNDDVAAQESIATAPYMPSISIDDIVELVKERLDQTPKNEQMAPMELVMTPGAAAPMTLIQSTKPEAQREAESEPESEPEQESQPEQELILPIYKRISNAEPSMSKVQTLPVTVSKLDTETEKESLPQLEVREPKSQSLSLFPSLSHGKMDARKRRFLFRADAS